MCKWSCQKNRKSITVLLSRDIRQIDNIAIKRELLNFCHFFTPVTGNPFVSYITTSSCSDSVRRCPKCWYIAGLQQKVQPNSGKCGSAHKNVTGLNTKLMPATSKHKQALILRLNRLLTLRTHEHIFKYLRQSNEHCEIHTATGAMA